MKFKNDASLGAILLAGQPDVAVQVVPSPRGRRLSLKVSRQDGSVRISMPKHASRSEAEAFVRSKEQWIRKHLAGQSGVEEIAIGTILPVNDIPRLICMGDVGRARLTHDSIVVPQGDAMTGARVATLLKTLARRDLQAASEAYAGRLGVSFARMALKDTSSRWGSCSSRGNLNYSWRLIMAPPQVLDYVAAHEVAHLIEMNHSSRFWGQVAKICPNYKALRQWLH
ncbi:MAG: M48 family metallopeptidase, partial [Planktomarina sp.]